MLDRILTFLHLKTNPFADADTGHRYCSFECYDDGGCEKCGTWQEWDDPEYGTVGRWIEHPDHGTLRDWKQTW